MSIMDANAEAHVNVLAEEFFGDECYLEDHETLIKPAINRWVRGMLTLTWNRWRSSFGREVKKLRAAQSAYEQLEKGK